MKLEVGYILRAFDHSDGHWNKAKITAVYDELQNTTTPSHVTLEFIEGDNKGLEWNETFPYLNDPIYYRKV